MNGNSWQLLRNHRALFLCLMMLLGVILLTDPVVAGLVVSGILVFAFTKSSDAKSPSLTSEA